MRAVKKTLLLSSFVTLFSISSSLSAREAVGAIRGNEVTEQRPGTYSLEQNRPADNQRWYQRESQPSYPYPYYPNYYYPNYYYQDDYNPSYYPYYNDYNSPQYNQQQSDPSQASFPYHPV